MGNGRVTVRADDRTDGFFLHGVERGRGRH